MALFAFWRDDMVAAPADVLHGRLAGEAHVVPDRTDTLAIETMAGCWRIAAFACATRFYSAGQQVWSAPGRGACLLQGVVWQMRGGDGRLLDAEALAHMLADPDDAVPSDLLGEFAVVRLFPDGSLLAFGDPAGVHQLFHRPDHPYMLASRAGFLAALVDDWTPARESALWLAAIGYRAGRESGWRGVMQVPPGHVWRAGGGVRALPRPDRFDGPRGFARGGEELLEEGRAQAIAAIRLATGDDEVRLPVTGGKDSRAVLALALAAGLDYDRLTLVTRGTPDHPDVRAAERIAAAVGLRHQREAPRFDNALDVAAVVSQLAAHVYQTDGGMGGWDLLVGAQPGRGTMLTGHMGEVLKTQRKRAPDPADPADMVRQQAPFDPLGLLRPDARASLMGRLRDQADAATAEGATADDLPDLFYYRNRLPNWLGGIRGVRAHEHQPVMPLGVPALQRLAFQLTAEERGAELIHFRLVRDCAPALVPLPFAHQRWSRGLPGAPDVPPLLAGAGAALFGNWQWALNRQPALRQWLATFVGAADIPLWEGLDRPRLLQALRDRRFDYRDAIALLGLIAAAFHQSGTIIPRKIGSATPAPVPPRPATPPVFGTEGRSQPLAGHIDGIEGAPWSGGDRLRLPSTGIITVTGWALAPDWPGAAPAIEARADGAVVGTAYPDRERPDLAILGVPHVRHGFTLVVDAAKAEGAAELTVGSVEAPIARFSLVRDDAA